MASDCNKQEILVGDKVFRLTKYCSHPLTPNTEYTVIDTTKTSIRLKEIDIDTRWDSFKFEIRPRIILNWEEAMLKC